MAQKLKLAPVRVKHLDAGQIGVHEKLRGIDDSLVESWGSSSGDQLRSELLKPLCGFDLQREQVFAPAQCLLSGFQFPVAVPCDALHSGFHLLSSISPVG